MPKRITLRPKSRTHFEQVSLDVVRKVAVLHISKKQKSGAGSTLREPASRKTEPYSMGAHRYQ